MMIEIKGLVKRFGNRTIYENVFLSLPRRGVIAIVGDSGSGKTTLLNAIAGLDFDYEGEITIDEVNLKHLDKDSLCDYRIHNIGYVFQNFNLLNLDNVETNILVPFDSTSNSSRRIKQRKLTELTKMLGISSLIKEPVNKLSGGEKQRVAIARAMINSPKVILCDEPTGALDENNSKQIYDILKKISANSLIIIASHDIEGVSKIADKIISIKNEKLIVSDIEKKEEETPPNLLNNNNKISKASLSLRFKIKHSLQKIKEKKYRSLITNGILSLSLTGIGLSIILATSVSNKIQEAFSSLINGNQIVVSLKNESQNSFTSAYSAPFNKVESIKNKYKYYIDDVGVTYLVNFEDFFKTRNNFHVSSSAFKIDLPYYSTRSINDFRILNNKDMVMYPFTINELQDDQVVLGLTYQDMTNLCFNLHILRNFSSLGHYIHEHKLFITLEVENADWQYDDEQIFEVKAVTESHRSVFYHTNSLWNERVFEDMMRLPSDDDSEHFYPWEMSKIYYLETLSDPSEFLDVAFYEEDLQDYVFERTSSSYHPLLCTPNEVCEERRLLVFLADKNGINPNHIKYMAKADNVVKDYYFNSDFGYASYASNLLSGFSKNVFVSLDENKINMAVDADSQLDKKTNVNIDLPSGVVQGNFLNGISGGLRFSSKIDKLIEGRRPNNVREIVISKGLAKNIDPDGVGIGKYLYIAGEINEYLSEEEHLIKDYRADKVVVVGIVDEELNYLYHDPMWTISFFRDRLGVSNFYLIPKSAVIELDQNVDSNLIISKFNKVFKDYNFSSPVNELSKSVESTLKYANAILMGFSILSSLISILLLGTVVLLNVLESKDEIGLFNIIGIKQKDIDSIFVYQSLIQGLIAFVLSAVELIVVDFVISKALGNVLHTSLSYSFNILPILIVFLFAVILPLVTSFVLVKSLTLKSRKSVAKSKHTC